MSKYYSTPNVQGSPLNQAAFNQAGEATRGTLEQLLKGKQSSELLAQGQSQKDVASKDREQRAQDLFKKMGGKTGVSLSEEGASLSPHENPMALIKQEQFDQSQANKLSGLYNKVGGFNSALQDIEKQTNREGTGGVLSNPQAKLISTGKMLSAVPTQGLGLAEMIGAAPKGSAEERKSLERLQLEYQKAMTGARTSEQMAAREKQALGWMASGDPDLVAKGVRSLAHNIKNNLQTSQAGFNPRVRDMVHSTMGDPLDTYRNLDAAEGPTPQQVAPLPVQGGPDVSIEAWKRSLGAQAGGQSGGQ